MRHSLPRIIAERILTDCVESGQVAPGERLPTVRELEAHYAVSRTTVVHALAILEQQGRLVKRQGSGCYVSEPIVPPAGGLSAESDSPRLVAFIADYAETELMLHVHEGIDRACHTGGYHVLAANSQGDLVKEQQQVRRAVQAGCLAVVLVPVTRTRSQLRADYLLTEFTDLPIVLVDIAYPEQRRSQVVFDNYHAGYDLTRLLLREGHRRIAFMDTDRPDDPVMHTSTRERYKGYLDAMRAEGVTSRPEDRWVIADHPCLVNVTRYALPFLVDWRSRPDRPTALIAIDDTAAMQTIHLAKQLGIVVPDQLRLVGFDNTATARTFYPPFPTTTPDFRKAGELAAEIAIRQIGDPAETQAIYVLPAPILERTALDLEHWPLSTITTD